MIITQLNFAPAVREQQQQRPLPVACRHLRLNRLSALNLDPAARARTHVHTQTCSQVAVFAVASLFPVINGIQSAAPPLFAVDTDPPPTPPVLTEQSQQRGGCGGVLLRLARRFFECDDLMTRPRLKLVTSLANSVI